MNMDTDLARRNMTMQQVRCWDVSRPRVLAALEDVPREHFVPERYADLAFADVMLPLDAGAGAQARSMLTPKLEGRILQELDIQPHECALVIGTGSGFLTACTARLARHVTSIDSSADMIDGARRRLDDLGITNVELRVQDMYDRPAAAQFDAIAVTGSMPVYDPRVEAWLKPGGRAFIVVGTAPAMEARLVERSKKGEICYRSLFETVIPALANSRAPERFRF